MHAPAPIFNTDFDVRTAAPGYDSEPQMLNTLPAEYL